MNFYNFFLTQLKFIFNIFFADESLNRDKPDQHEHGSELRMMSPHLSVVCLARSSRREAHGGVHSHLGSPPLPHLKHKMPLEEGKHKDTLSESTVCPGVGPWPCTEVYPHVHPANIYSHTQTRHTHGAEDVKAYIVSDPLFTMGSPTPGLNVIPTLNITHSSPPPPLSRSNTHCLSCAHAHAHTHAHPCRNTHTYSQRYTHTYIRRWTHKTTCIIN